MLYSASSVLIHTDMLENPCPSQTRNDKTRKRRSDRSVETSAERPPKRTRLTEKNLKAFEKMGGRQRKSVGRRSSGQSSSTTTTTDKDFGPQLQRNNVIYTALDARAPDDIADVRESLDRTRESEPPDHLAYKQYLVNTEGLNNELTLQISAYPLIAKRTSAEQEISGYMQSVNYAWSEVDNHLTTGLSDAKPDIFESYRKTDYPPEAVDALSSAIAPTVYNIAMPAYAVEFKGCDGSMAEAQLQCAYDGALMTEGARAVHTHMDKSEAGFYSKTQALTVAYNGDTVKFYGHHAIQIPPSSQPPSGGVDNSADTNSNALAYHQYVLSSDNPRDSFENFQKAYKHTRNAQDIGYKWATERKDALWAYTNRDKTQTSPDVPTSTPQLSSDPLISISSVIPGDCNCDAYDHGISTSAQQLTDSLPPVSSAPPAGYNCNASDDEDPTDQLLRESWTVNGDVSPDAQTYNPITPPPSSKDVSVPFESQQLSLPTVTEPGDIVDLNSRSHRKTRARTHHAVVLEEPREVNKTKPRRTRTTYYVS
ncbi:hypothetical protein ONS96_001896 [Cadophora gregata f. sp. sojae]|nr:hypothetical protein ONS96_001896 [Cadophora gregata f. sp. sojae]